MTKKEAVAILIDHAAKNCVGSGLGYHTIPSSEEKALVLEAIKRVWKYAYDWEFSESDRRNLGISVY